MPKEGRIDLSTHIVYTRDTRLGIIDLIVADIYLFAAFVLRVISMFGVTTTVIHKVLATKQLVEFTAKRKSNNHNNGTT